MTDELPTQTQCLSLKIDDNSDDELTADDPVWGQLVLQRTVFKKLGTYSNGFAQPYTIPAKKHRKIELKGGEFTYGRAINNSFVAKLENLANNNRALSVVSKQQFRIVKSDPDKSETAVFLFDMSRNGTYVNEQLVGPGRKVAITTGDYISINNPKLKIFLYEDINAARPILTGASAEIKKKYCVIKQVGTGSFGQVYLALEKNTCREVAVKHINKERSVNGSQNQSAISPTASPAYEVAILRRLDHPCVTTILEPFETPNALDIVMDYMHGGDLLNRIIDKGHLPEAPSRCFFYQMLKAVEYLHDQGITHRDLKADNILLMDNREFTLAKVSDFGLSKFVERTIDLKSAIGTPSYAAPEVIRLMAGEKGTYTNKVDVWSLAVVLFTMVSGTMPFCEAYEGSISEQILKARYRFAHRVWLNLLEPQDLIRKTLQVDPTKRPTIAELLGHKWLATNRKGVEQAIRLIKEHSGVRGKENNSDSPNLDTQEEPPKKRSRQ